MVITHEGGVKFAAQIRQHRVQPSAVRVVLPEPLPPHYAQMLERVARSCPAHNTLAHGAEIAVEIERPAIVA